jgi:hypothetical protein
MKDKYPEHTKLKAIQPQSQKVGEFLEWLQTQSWEITKYSRNGEEYLPIYLSTEEILAKFFEIDLNKIETEKRAMLDEQRKLNEADQEWGDETPPELQ